MDYHYLVFNQKEFFKNEVLEEVLRERANYYNSKNRLMDFWILVSPNWLFSSDISKKFVKTCFYIKDNNSDKNYYSILISTDIDFIKWVRLRVGDFENIDDFNPNLANYKINGLYGTLNNKDYNDLLSNNSNYVNSDILINQYKYLLKQKYLKLSKILID